MIDNNLTKINICNNLCNTNKVPDKDNVCQDCHSDCV